MTTVVNLRTDSYDVYIGRPMKSIRGSKDSLWGNAFVIGLDGTREEVIAKYCAWLRFPERAGLVQQAREKLKDKILGCWCKPEACHGDVLAAIANGEEL